jgi:hypothetical protein
MRSWSRIIRTSGLLAALSLAAAASQAGAAVQLGQLAPNNAIALAVSDYEEVQLSVVSGTSYTVPGTGTITYWSTNANGTANQTWTMKVFRPVGGSTYSVVGHEGPRALTASAVNTFPASVPVQPGDLLGFHSASINSRAIFVGDPGDLRGFRFGNLADGQSGDFTQAGGDRLNIAAVFEPSNSFSFLRTKRNPKNGTATLTVRVPNPGELVLAGKGVARAGGGAVVAKTVSAPGKVKLRVRVKGKQRRKLNEVGKAGVKPKVTFAPAGGAPRTRSTKVKLTKLG